MFFAFPLNSRPDWRNPPLATLLLILVNCIVFFGPQRWDAAALDKALAYYVDSDLPHIELPRFLEHLRHGSRPQQDASEWVQAALAAQDYAPVATLMENDRAFVAALRSGTLLRPVAPEYPAWREQRRHFETLRGQPFTTRWASIPADWQPASLVTAAFLHADVIHLLGNMVFLFVFGYTVELALGRPRYLAYYLLAAIGAELGDLAVRWGSLSMGLGASGAVSGLMALYVVLYGRQRIRFFYQLLFYFDTVKAPAIVLLPVWLAHELLQQQLQQDHVAHMAHAGGLLSGALLAWDFRRRHSVVQLPSDEPSADPTLRQRARARELLQALRIDAACTAYAALARQLPQDAELVLQFFNLAKLQPASADFHGAAALVFGLEQGDDATEGKIHEAFMNYLLKAVPGGRFSSAQLARLALRFARLGQATDAARLSRALLARAPAHEDLPRVLLAASNALARNRDAPAAAELAGALCAKFPQSAEARIVAELYS